MHRIKSLKKIIGRFTAILKKPSHKSSQYELSDVLKTCFYNITQEIIFKFFVEKTAISMYHRGIIHLLYIIIFLLKIPTSQYIQINLYQTIFSQNDLM